MTRFLAYVHRCHHERPVCRYCGASWCPRCDGLHLSHLCEESRDPDIRREVDGDEEEGW